jgi:hypothetical protein
MTIEATSEASARLIAVSDALSMFGIQTEPQDWYPTVE